MKEGTGMDYRKTAHEILAAIGGKDNLASAAHCATRLRLVIADNGKVKKSVLENIDGVKGVFEASGQLQIIIGTGTVNKVYDEFIAEAGIEAASKEDVKAAAAAKSPWYKRAIKALGNVPDHTFAAGVPGLGAAVEPSEGVVIAPADGTVGTLFDTHHAIGLDLDSGAELLIHIGINTVELNGEGFTAYVSEGDRVKKGQKLISFDKKFIESKGYKTVTPVIVTNSDDYKSVKLKASGSVGYNDVLIELEKE